MSFPLLSIWHASHQALIYELEQLIVTQSRNSPIIYRTWRFLPCSQQPAGCALSKT